MLVVGGHDFTSGPANRYWQMQDPFPQGLGLFNMTAMSWVKDYTYHADAQAYKSPQVVEDWYKGRDLSYIPWSSNNVKDIFLAKPVLFDNSNSNSTASVGPTTTTTSGNNKVGRIVGGTVRAFVGTAILLSLIYYVWIRKPTPSSLMDPGSHKGTLSSNNTKTELSTELLVTEMPVSLPELASREQTCELDTQKRIYELNVTSRTCELDAPNRTCAINVTSQIGNP